MFIVDVDVFYCRRIWW